MTTPVAEDQLARDLLQIYEDSYGVGADVVKVLSDENAIVVFLDGLRLQRNEEFLVEQGQGDQVVQTRQQFQQAIETPFRAAVERATGRRVVSFASITMLDPTYAIEIFRLAPESRTGPDERSAP
jgi:uncharacterized protein YbcI